MIETFAQARDAELEGRFWFGMLRRNGPVFVAGRWHDMSYAAGNPVANYYASAPLAAATLLGRDGIDTGPAPADVAMRKRLRTATLCPGATGGTRLFRFLDYVLYYPFVDGDGGLQDLDNTVPIPRSGEGCQVIAVCQGTGLALGAVRITYTNSAGVAGRQATTTLDLSVTPGVLSSSRAAAVADANPSGPFMALQHGDTGVNSIEQVEPLAAIGGIFALVIVKPLLDAVCPTATAAPVEVDGMADLLSCKDFEHGAYVHAIAFASAAGTPAVVGAIKTIWG